MFSKNTTNLFFNPGCALSLYRPENVTELFKYLQSNYPQIQMHNICCRHDPGCQTALSLSMYVLVVTGDFSTLYDGISTISLWEIIDNLNNFPFPNYHGMEVSVHDPCPVRNTLVVHKAVRGLLQKMNIKVIEAGKNRHGILSVVEIVCTRIVIWKNTYSHEKPGRQYAV